MGQNFEVTSKGGGRGGSCKSDVGTAEATSVRNGSAIVGRLRHVHLIASRNVSDSIESVVLTGTH